MKVPHALDEEFKRVTKVEGVTMEALVNEIAGLTGYTARHIYNFRSGKWKLDPDLIPLLCKRFRSRTLLNVLIVECQDVRIEVPDGFDLTRLVSQTVREDLEYYQQFLADFESNGIDETELAHLRELVERVVCNAYRFVEIAAQDYERRHALKESSAR
ncbi:MAG: hypothetical protein AUG51_16905 [Acidobacteria bacterium 13_1_20CM_3_53_8]|nr:MAG: hypothetical protein AUG51_16905 [Acidobacteria bacterium 13_1_20CM_3_53_8]